MTTQIGKMGRDCPICHEPNMEYIGKKTTPILLDVPKDSDLNNLLDIEYYHCKICEHVESKKVEAPTNGA